jgi:primosomal protein N' (replication factor Y)
MNIRKILKYPPYNNLALLKMISKEYELAYQESEKVQHYLVQHLPSSVLVLGPTAAPLPKYNNSYYFQILLKYKNSKEVRKELEFLIEKYKRNQKVTFDVDLSV